MLSLIVAMSENRVIGINNALPWHLPNDLQYFKRITMGKPIVMGRKTFESIGRPLPGRRNIIISRQEGLHYDGVDCIQTVEGAVSLGESIAFVEGHEEIMVIGGAQIYQRALPIADRLYITHVHSDITGDAYFPEVDWSLFNEVAREDFLAEGPNPYNYSFVVYDRIS
ncbi:type 3 dihydrofolate reductase [Marinomonas sp. 2405UD68-3]|uniref:type 3 dihydrofolate reductase n=1 Tax=Marinomonas sp. 2405UD68-3 TaxID=3391835 RepID=UPI0039C9C7BF